MLTAPKTVSGTIIAVAMTEREREREDNDMVVVHRLPIYPFYTISSSLNARASYVFRLADARFFHIRLIASDTRYRKILYGINNIYISIYSGFFYRRGEKNDKKNVNLISKQTASQKILDII